MKRILLFTLALSLLVTLLSGQSTKKSIVSLKQKDLRYYLDLSNSNKPGIPYSTAALSSNSNSSVLSVKLGSSGNLYTIIRGASNMVAYDKDINSAVFVHRNDPAVFAGQNVGQYRFDMTAGTNDSLFLEYVAYSFTVNGDTIDSVSYINTPTYFFRYDTSSKTITDSSFNQTVQIILYDLLNNPDSILDTLTVYSPYNFFDFDTLGVPDSVEALVPDTTLYLANDTIVTDSLLNINYYGFDSWTNNLGLLAKSGNTTDKACRYPQATIYNPAGNTNPDSAYLVYLGTFHNNGDWNGTASGVARLDGDSTSFTEHIDEQNGGDALIPSGLCKGTSGTFWTTDFAYDGTNSNSILIFKGIFNNTTKDVSWTISDFLDPLFDKSFDGTEAAAGLNMAFDPTGQIGWIAFAGDVSDPLNNSYHPIFFKTTDAGITWTGPIEVKPEKFPYVIYPNPDSTVNVMTTTFEADLVVDKNGDPHFCVSVTYGGNDYTVSIGSYVQQIVDYTYSSQNDSWYAIWLDELLTFRGDVSVSASPISTDNRPQLSTTVSGDKVFFFWADSDSLKADTSGQGVFQNTAPNIIGRALDINAKKLTPRYNFTKGDLKWDGKALFHSASANVITQGSKHLVPSVIAELGTSKSDLDPVNFHYLTDIGFEDSTFTETPDIPPTINLIGQELDTVFTNQPSYSDPGATAWDYNDGDLSDSVVASNNINFTTPGTYMIAYEVMDSDSNLAVAYRTIKVMFPIGIADVSLENAVSVYPNPVQDKLTININLPETQKVTIDIYNVLGKSIDKITEKETFNKSFIVDLSKNTSGVYIVKVSTDKETIIKKVVLSK